MQTAIDFLVEKLNKLETEKHLYKIIDYRIKKQSIVDEAKQMFEQQIIDAWHKGYDNQSPMIDEENCGQTYYTSTYGSKGSDECQFESTTNTSSATICKHCGREKFLHQ